jgi:hypothetical protein
MRNFSGSKVIRSSMLFRSLSTAAPALEDKNKIGLLRVVTGHDDGFLRIPGAVLRVELQGDCSLPSRRDCPVILGDHAASAGDDLLYIEDGFSSIPYTEPVNELLSAAEFSEIVSGFGKFRDRRRVGLSDGIGNVVGVSNRI